MKRVAATERKKLQGAPKLVVSLGPAPGSGALLAGPEPRRAADRAAPSRVQRLGGSREFPVGQLPDGDEDQGESRRARSHRRALSRRPRISAASTKSIAPG